MGRARQGGAAGEPYVVLCERRMLGRAGVYGPPQHRHVPRGGQVNLVRVQRQRRV